MDRRTFLSDLSRYAFFCAAVPTPWRVTSRPRIDGDPFTLGVASGDPLPDRCVIWTRLAPRPFEPEAGMEGQRTVVGWEVAEDDGFSRIVRRGRYTAAPELGYSVHVDVDGLQPDRWYVYRFHLPDGTSPVGRLRTAPAPDTNTPLEFAFTSCQHYEQGLYTAYEHMSAEPLDLVAHLGDYIYEHAAREDRVRAHHGYEISSLLDYRARYAQYKSDPALQAAHALCPWIVTWDDHEVDNNYASDFGENVFESREQVQLRRAAGYQAWWEHQPVRVPAADRWADLTIRRSLVWGRLARFWVLDTRQYRSDQTCGGSVSPVPCEDWLDPSRTLLGAPQEAWLMRGLGESSASWQVLAQQVMMAPFNELRDGKPAVHMDPWGGYPVARDRLLYSIGQRAPGRTVVITGDIHSNWVNDLHEGFDRPDRPVVATEFVSTSISSGGDGSEQWPMVEGLRDRNPHNHWQNARRGYVRCHVTEGEWTTRFRTVDYVSRPGSPVRTPTTWRLERGKPGVERTG